MLERFFNFLNSFAKSFFTFLKIIVRSNLFLSKFKTDQLSHCIILGNGPSLRTVLKENMEDLKKHTLLCVNKFPDTEPYTILKPRFFLFTSTGYFIPEKIKHEQEARDSIINALVTRTTWPLTVFCPSLAKSYPGFVNKIKSNPNIEVCYFNNTPVEGHRFFNHLFMKWGWGMPRPHNVLIPSIFTAINAGYKKIFLIGADHSWIPLISVNENNEALINQQHFYDSGQSHARHMYRNSQPRRLHEILEKFMLSFRAYFELKEYAEKLGVKIYNCTPGSYIDAFERLHINEILKEKTST